MNFSTSTRSFTALVCAMILFGGCSATSTTERPGSFIDEATEPRIESYLQNAVTEEHFSGVVLVVDDGRVVHAKGYGPARKDQPNSIETAFHVASLTKQFTAAAVLQLRERGALSLEDSINAYLPEEYRSSKWESVNVHHLLSHSSGIPDYAVIRDYYEIVAGFATDGTVDQMIKEAMAKDLYFPPGSQFRYSNLGYTLLGQIIENVAGIAYHKHVSVNILEPMSMSASRIRIAGQHVPAPDEAAGFYWGDEQAAYSPDTTETLPATAPDGGLITTARDFARWVQVYTGAGRSILSDESIGMMLSKHIDFADEGAVDAYGYGLGVGDRLIAHSGHVAGFRSQFLLARETDTLILIFSNNAAIDMDRLVGGLLALVFSGSA